MPDNTVVAAVLRQFASDYQEVVSLLYTRLAERRAHHLRNIQWLEAYVKQLERADGAEEKDAAPPRVG